MDGHTVIAEVSAQLGGAWQLVRKLPGGLNQGAYLLRGPAGQMAVLKWHPAEPDRVAAAAPVIKAARARLAHPGLAQRRVHSPGNCLGSCRSSCPASAPRGWTGEWRR